MKTHSCIFPLFNFMVFGWISGLISHAVTLDTVDVGQLTPLGPPPNSFIEAKVVDVYDGDTITIIFQLGGMFFKDKLRLASVDAPEIKTRNAAEKAAAIRSRDWLKEQVLNKHIYVQFGREVKEKYGRLIGYVYPADAGPPVNNGPALNVRTLNQQLIALGYAVEYDGGSKKPFVADEETA